MPPRPPREALLGRVQGVPGATRLKACGSRSKGRRRRLPPSEFPVTETRCYVRLNHAGREGHRQARLLVDGVQRLRGRLAGAAVRGGEGVGGRKSGAATQELSTRDSRSAESHADLERAAVVVVVPGLMPEAPRISEPQV
jgi:hypothetical protein